MSKKNHKIFTHCDLDTTVDKEKSVVNVTVTYKQETLEALPRHRYNAYDVLEAVQQTGLPVVSIVDGLTTTLDNRAVEYRVGEYAFSLIEKSSGKKSSSKPRTKKASTSSTK